MDEHCISQWGWIPRPSQNPPAEQEGNTPPPDVSAPRESDQGLYRDVCCTRCVCDEMLVECGARPEPSTGQQSGDDHSCRAISCCNTTSARRFSQQACGLLYLERRQTQWPCCSATAATEMPRRSGQQARKQPPGDFIYEGKAQSIRRRTPLAWSDRQTCGCAAPVLGNYEHGNYQEAGRRKGTRELPSRMTMLLYSAQDICRNSALLVWGFSR